jgi:MFS family permease
LTTIQGPVADELDAYEEAVWFTAAHLVAYASVSPVTGKLSYIIAPRYFIFFSTFLFSIGSLITGVAGSLPVFLLGRAISGVGAAGQYNVGVVLILRLSRTKNRGLLYGALNSGYTFGVALGAIVAGALEPIIGWRALFWGQGPIVLTAGTVLLLTIPHELDESEIDQDEDEPKSTWARLLAIDYLGALLLVVSIVVFLYGLASPTIKITPIIIAAAIFPFFLLQESYGHPDPIIPISILRSRSAICTCLSTFLFMVVRWAVLFFTPIFATAVRGWAPAASGSLLLPTNIGFATGSILTGVFHIRRPGSYYTACLVLFVLFPVSLALLALAANASNPVWVIVVCIFSNGLFAGAALNYMIHHALHLVLPEVRFIITALLTTFRGFSGTFGSAVGGGVFLRLLRSALERGFAEQGLPVDEQLIRRLLGSPRAVNSLQGVEKTVGIEAYTYAIKTLFLSGVALSILTFILQAAAGNEAPDQEVPSRSRTNSSRIVDESGSQ